MKYNRKAAVPIRQMVEQNKLRMKFSDSIF
jgi:hypothetical protein